MNRDYVFFPFSLGTWSVGTVSHCQWVRSEALFLPNAKVAGSLDGPSDTWLPFGFFLGLDRQTLDLVGPGTKVQCLGGFLLYQWLLSALLLQGLETKTGLELGDGGGSIFPGMDSFNAPLQPDWPGIRFSAEVT